MTSDKHIAIVLALAALLMAGLAHADGWAPGTKASNIGSIANTRHNMTASFSPGMSSQLEPGGVYNNYGEVCVYCHTPHGANTTISAPLWNRTNKATTYTLYNIPLQSGQTPTNPGVNSLTCLSCHDGTVSIDAVINMPGSGKYSAAKETTSDGLNDAFLSTWQPGLSDWHGSLVTCTISCHGAGMGADFNFSVFKLGTDLTNDHPVGVQLPDTNVYDFKAPTGTSGALKFFDTNSNGKPDKSEVRFYNTGGGFEVECASCHDPHGVPSAGPGSVFIPSFLRVSNAGSVLCMTCHDK